jgi:hypothetical protein
MTANLKNNVAGIANKTATVFTGIGEVGASGLSCIASSVNVAASASVSVKVSVSASASVQGQSG